MNFLVPHHSYFLIFLKTMFSVWLDLDFEHVSIVVYPNSRYAHVVGSCSIVATFVVFDSWFFMVSKEP
jgi:hypothetical protein